MEFSFTLADQSRRQRHSTGLHLMVATALLGMGLAGFGMFWYTSVSDKFTASYRPLALFAACCVLLGLGLFFITIARRRWLEDRRRAAVLRAVEVAALVAVTGVLLLADWYKPALIIGALSLVVLFSLFWERTRGQIAQAHFSESGIRLSGAARGYRWPEVTAVRYRGGVLSIELLRNRLWQEHVVAVEHLDEETFLLWCQAQILKSAAARGREW